MSEPNTADLLLQSFQATSLATMVTDREGRILAVNDAFSALTGWPAAEAVGRSPRILSSGRQDADFYEGMWAALETEGHWRGELWNRRKGGEVFPEHLTIDAVRDAAGSITHFVGIFADISERKQREARLTYLAFHDPLTGLPNRSLCEDRAERAISLARRRAGQIGVLMIDLDGFKKVNDSLGHDCGDLILKAAGERLRACLRDSDTVARWGGDEFVVILPTVDSAAGVRETGLRMLSALRRPYVLAGDEIKLGGSIGAALFPGDGEDAEEIFACADRAMYGVKRTGKGGFNLYGDADTGRRLRRSVG
jgi:diguanylate cyclase (GGDEF)-like protein/PAS domain S-box-containing protein